MDDLRISESEMESHRRMGAVQVAIQSALGSLIDRHPDLTYIEVATALVEVAQRKLMHQLRAEVSEEGPDHG